MTPTRLDANGRWKTLDISRIYRVCYGNSPWTAPATAQHGSQGMDAVLVSLPGVRKRI